MKVKILHEGKGRLRIHMMQKYMSYEQADTLAYYLAHVVGVTHVKVCDKTCNAVIEYKGVTKKDILESLEAFSYRKVNVPAVVLADSECAKRNKRQEAVVRDIAKDIVVGLLPAPIQFAVSAYGYYQKLA